jgi:hypothetical protein
MSKSLSTFIYVKKQQKRSIFYLIVFWSITLRALFGADGGMTVGGGGG